MSRSWPIAASRPDTDRLGVSSSYRCAMLQPRDPTARRTGRGAGRSGARALAAKLARIAPRQAARGRSPAKTPQLRCCAAPVTRSSGARSGSGGRRRSTASRARPRSAPITWCVAVARCWSPRSRPATRPRNCRRRRRAGSCSNTTSRSRSTACFSCAPSAVRSTAWCFLFARRLAIRALDRIAGGDHAIGLDRMLAGMGTERSCPAAGRAAVRSLKPRPPSERVQTMS